MNQPWSVKFARCIRCGKNDRPHASNGLCMRCYGADYRRKFPFPRRHHTPHFQAANQLFERGYSSSEIAKALGITHQYAGQLTHQNPTAKRKTVPRTCQRCGQQYLGGRNTHLCSRCTTAANRAVRFCAKCGKRKSLSAKICWRCYKEQQSVFSRPQQLRLAKRLRLQGWTYARIASHLHRADMTVWNAINGPRVARPLAARRSATCCRT